MKCAFMAQLFSNASIPVLTLGFMGMLVFDPELVNEPCRETIREFEQLCSGIRGQTITYPQALPFALYSCFSESRSCIQGGYWRRACHTLVLAYQDEVGL